MGIGPVYVMPPAPLGHCIDLLLLWSDLPFNVGRWLLCVCILRVTGKEQHEAGRKTTCCYLGSTLYSVAGEAGL